MIQFFFVQLSTAQIRVTEPSKNLGEIFESGGKVSTYFTLFNPFVKDTIHILDVETSCGCTAIFSQDTLIMPGKSIDVEVVYDPSGRLGLFVKSVAVVHRTGNSVSTVYLNITGNVISATPQIKVQKTELLEYKVSPIYYYPITPFDTSYLDFSYIVSFVNDLTYEIDYYQFTTIGFEVAVADMKYIEELEYLLNFSRAKLVREFKQRGYFPTTVFFDEPVFYQDKIPSWSSARIKVYSTNFNSEITEESVIAVTQADFVENLDLLLDYNRFSLPLADEIVNEINFELLEGKLFMNGRLDLKGMVLKPSKASDKDVMKLLDETSSLIFKKMKKLTGVNKDELTIVFDSIGVHPENKYRFVMWDKNDQQENHFIRYEIKEDKITPPLLPTYKQSLLTRTTIDTSHREFKLFWKNLLMNSKAGHDIQLVIETSVSKIPRSGVDDNLVLSRKRGTEIAEFLNGMFKKETGKEISFVYRPFVHGPDYTKELKKNVDYAQYEYVNLIPLTHSNGEDKALDPHPYQVNFDYYFNGVDTASWLFDKFANYIAAAVEQDGFVEIRIESSISKIPIEHELSNDYLVYARAQESEKRLRLYLKTKLIDPNRIIFSEQRYLVQGPEYDGTIPIIQFRKFQYVKLIPQKYLTQN